jgi:hypothetical protein
MLCRDRGYDNGVFRRVTPCSLKGNVSGPKTVTAFSQRRVCVCPRRAVLMRGSVHTFLMLVSCWNWLLRRYKPRCREETGACLPTKRAENNLNSAGDLVDHTYKCLSVLIALRPCWFNSRNVWVGTSCSRLPVQGLQASCFLVMFTFFTSLCFVCVCLCARACIFLSTGRRSFCPLNWGLPSLLFKGYRSFFPTHLDLVPRLRMSGAVPLSSLLLMPSWHGQEQLYLAFVCVIPLCS